MSFFSKIGRGLGNLAKGVVSVGSSVVKGAVGVAAGALGLSGGGQSTIHIALDKPPDSGVQTQATFTREPASPIPAGEDRSKLGEANALGGNTMLLVAGGLALLLLTGRK